ncbi:MAG: hypothetical protein M3525_11120, partial [Acidobacteriota bacterium]|nr:hypothetical protein [Acidobacteriota bacterium]
IKMKKLFALVFSALLFVSTAQAQSAEVAVSLNERFFDALLDAIFTNLKSPSFPIAQSGSKFKVQSSKSVDAISAFQESSLKIQNLKPNAQNLLCDESIRLRREIDGVRTAVRFRDGKIYAPLAFAGSYNPPFVGCVDFQGYAETNIELEFDKAKQTLIGRAKVLNVVLSGTGGVGSALLTRIVQNSLDKKINPIQILQTDKLSFLIPVQNAGGALRMRATGIRSEISNGALTIYIAFEFVKG